MSKRLFEISYKNRRWVEEDDYDFDAEFTKVVEAPTFAAALHTVFNGEELSTLERILTQWVVEGKNQTISIKGKFKSTPAGWAEDMFAREVFETDLKIENCSEDDLAYSKDFFSYLGIKEP